MSIVEFKVHGRPPKDEPLSVKGTPIIRRDGTPVMAHELTVGKTYAVDTATGILMMPPASNRAERRRAAKERKP